MQRARLASQLVALLLTVWAVPTARAEPAASASTVAERDLDARLVQLEAYHRELRRPMRGYVIGWASGLSALAVAQGTMAAFEDDPGQRAILIVGGSLSLLGVTVTVAIPSKSRKTARAYQAQPIDTPADKREKLRLGEEVLSQSATAARRMRSWYMHALAGALGVGVTLSLGLAFDDLWPRAVVAGAGAVVGVEVRVWTHPTRALRFQRDYRERRAPFTPVPLVGPNTVGLGFAGAF